MILLVYDVTNPNSFQNLDKWLEMYTSVNPGRPLRGTSRSRCGEDSPMALQGLWSQIKPTSTREHRCQQVPAKHSHSDTTSNSSKPLRFFNRFPRRELRRLLAEKQHKCGYPFHVPGKPIQRNLRRCVVGS